MECVYCGHETGTPEDEHEACTDLAAAEGIAEAEAEHEAELLELARRRRRPRDPE